MMMMMMKDEKSENIVTDLRVSIRPPRLS